MMQVVSRKVYPPACPLSQDLSLSEEVTSTCGVVVKGSFLVEEALGEWGGSVCKVQ